MLFRSLARAGEAATDGDGSEWSDVPTGGWVVTGADGGSLVDLQALAADDGLHLALAEDGGTELNTRFIMTFRSPDMVASDPDNTFLALTVGRPQWEKLSINGFEVEGVEIEVAYDDLLEVTVPYEALPYPGSALVDLTRSAWRSRRSSSIATPVCWEAVGTVNMCTFF